jgi:hypothetical protein
MAGTKSRLRSGHLLRGVYDYLKMKTPIPLLRPQVGPASSAGDANPDPWLTVRLTSNIKTPIEHERIVAMSGSLIDELRAAADEEDNSVGVQQDYCHSALLRKAADALASLAGGQPLHAHLLLPYDAKLIARKPSEKEVQDVCWQINRKQSADRVDKALVQDVWSAVVYLAMPVPGMSVIYSSSASDAGKDAGEQTPVGASPAKIDEISVRPLDENKTVGWTDGNGRFCLPLSFGYYIKFPKKDDTSSMFMAWFYHDPIGGSSDYKETKRMAQEHHKRRILSSVDPVLPVANTAERGRLFDANSPMADGDVPMTATEEVLAYLLVEKIGVPDDVPYTPAQAQHIVEERLKLASELEEIGAMLREGQGDDEGSAILPDFAKGSSVYAQVESCLHLLERRRDVIEGFVASERSAQ